MNYVWHQETMISFRYFSHYLNIYSSKMICRFYFMFLHLLLKNRNLGSNVVHSTPDKVLYWYRKGTAFLLINLCVFDFVTHHFFLEWIFDYILKIFNDLQMQNVDLWSLENVNFNNIWLILSTLRIYYVLKADIKLVLM